METPFKLVTFPSASCTLLELKQLGFDVSTSFVHDNTFLLSAINGGDIPHVKELLELGANVNFGYWNKLPLNVAVCVDMSVDISDSE